MRGVLAALALLALVATGCKKVGSKTDEIGAAIYRTESTPRAFVYAEGTPYAHAQITGVIQDDYRYAVHGTFPPESYVDEIGMDDALAIRTNDSHFVTRPGSNVKPNQWLVDPKANNDLWNHAPSGTTDEGPIYDSLTVLRYVRTAIGEAQDVVLFNPESQDYRPKFDPFPRPEKGTVRYDLVAPALKPRDASTAVGQASQLPGLRYFRRMSLYVNGGIVSEIREQISVYSALSDPRSHVAARIGDYGITLPKGSLRAQARYLTDTMNATAQRLGLPSIGERTLDVTFTSKRGTSGREVNVVIPAGAVRANLRGISAAGQVLYETTG